MTLLSPALSASGLLNFFGDGYWYHSPYKLIPGFSFRGLTFVSKTTTLDPRSGNMALKGTTPKEWQPDCIWTNLRQGITLNAVGLSGPGAAGLLAAGEWQKRTNPFWISFMSVAITLEDRLAELENFIALVKKETFNAEFGLQINLSCPNQNGVDSAKAISDASLLLELTRLLDAPVMLKVSATTSPDLAVELSKHPRCAAISVSNTIPFGGKPEIIDWKKFFPGEKPADSPLFKQFAMAGGLSGPPLFPLTVAWVKEAKKLGIACHLNAGGGIFSKQCVKDLKEAGANSVSIGTVAIHRPWRVQGIINEAHRQFSRLSKA